MLKYLPSNFFSLCSSHADCSFSTCFVYSVSLLPSFLLTFTLSQSFSVSLLLYLFYYINVSFPLSLFTFLFISIYLPFSFSPLSFYLSLYNPFALLSNYHFYYYAPNLPTFFLSFPDNKLISNFLNSFFLFHSLYPYFPLVLSIFLYFYFFLPLSSHFSLFHSPFLPLSFYISIFVLYTQSFFFSELSSDKFCSVVNDI
jgi:hypothetical protein